MIDAVKYSAPPAGRPVRRSGESHQSLFDCVEDAVVVLDGDGLVRHYNQPWLSLAQLLTTTKTAVGNAFAEHLVDDYRNVARDCLAAASMGHESRTSWIVDANTQHAIFLDVRFAPIPTTTYRDGGVAIVLRDVSHITNLQRQLARAQKMEGVGRLAAGIAHDFNNTLTAVIGYCELVLRRLDRDSEAYSDCSEAIDSARQAATVVRQLLSFSRTPAASVIKTDVASTISNMERLLARLVSEDIKIEMKNYSESLIASVDPGQLGQVVTNIVVNARDAMPEGGTITLKTSRTTIGSEERRQPLIPPGEYALLEIADTGHGMDAAVIEHVFEPFYTTKGPSKGTGIGLSTCYDIIKHAGGHITVSSERGHGATFRVYLPLAGGDRQAGPNGAASVEDASSDCDAVILLVEDDASVRMVTERVLTQHGYEVLTAAGPMEALDLATARGVTIDLILSDCVMPVMDGVTMARMLQMVLGPTPVLLTSGHTEFNSSAPWSGEAREPFLEKPFTAAALVGAVRSALSTWSRSRDSGS